MMERDGVSNRLTKVSRKINRPVDGVELGDGGGCGGVRGLQWKEKLWRWRGGSRVGRRTRLQVGSEPRSGGLERNQSSSQWS